MEYSHFLTSNILDEIEKSIQRKSHILRICFNYTSSIIEELVAMLFIFFYLQGTFKGERSINKIIHQ